MDGHSFADSEAGARGGEIANINDAAKNQRLA
jgi:hypothetical protein